MAEELEKLWEKRRELQKWDLIGGTSPAEEGNGYHDRLSFDFYANSLLKSNENVLTRTEEFSYYFNNLASNVNPSYFSDFGREFQKSIKLDSCSEGYRATFYKYLGGANNQYNKGISETLGRWGSQMVYNGRVILEFVSWKDRKNDIFYGFELKRLRPECSKMSFKNVQYGGIFLDSEGKKFKKVVSIPKDKCIIIQWPKELGGYTQFKKTSEKIKTLGNKHDSVSELVVNNQAGLAIEKMKEWEVLFASHVSDWGTNNPHNNLTEFFRMLQFFRYKETLIHCLNALICGLQQVVTILNGKFEEQAILTFTNDVLNISNLRKMKKKWIDGELSFTDANSYLNSLS